MISVSREDDAQTDRRLRGVCRSARFERLPGTYAYRELATADLHAALDGRSLAMVRDGDRWSRLAPVQEGDTEPLAVFSVHFPLDVDNSGFVGWLASRLKARLGTGVIVVCGLNTADGGIYDYWGAPIALADAVAAELTALAAGGSV